uniref:RRM domain-containing protein n=1 Tax=Neogobius melanostomus TaxID=47308 RepID=A0A8C6URG0_9GOBI
MLMRLMTSLFVGYCLYVGNLDNSKYYEEIRNSLANYFMTQSLLVQDIRLDKAKKHAFVDLASQMDLTKALALNGQKLLDKPLKIAKAKAKEADAAKKTKDPQEVQKSKNLRCVHVENLPSSATREDVLKVFPKATAVRFLGGTDSPGKGIAFVEFQNKEQADAARGQSGTATIRESVLRVNVVRESAGVRKPTTDSKNNKKAEAPPSDTLFVSNLPVKVQPKHLKKIFKSAVQIRIPQSDGKSKGFAFVEFASVAHAAKALKSSKIVRFRRGCSKSSLV